MISSVSHFLIRHIASSFPFESAQSNDLADKVPSSGIGAACQFLEEQYQYCVFCQIHTALRIILSELRILLEKAWSAFFSKSWQSCLSRTLSSDGLFSFPVVEICISLCSDKIFANRESCTTPESRLDSLSFRLLAKAFPTSTQVRKGCSRTFSTSNGSALVSRSVETFVRPAVPGPIFHPPPTCREWWRSHHKQIRDCHFSKVKTTPCAWTSLPYKRAEHFLA